jgi:hypothetical protein
MFAIAPISDLTRASRDVSEVIRHPVLLLMEEPFAALAFYQ